MFTQLILIYLELRKIKNKEIRYQVARQLNLSIESVRSKAEELYALMDLK